MTGTVRLGLFAGLLVACCVVAAIAIASGLRAGDPAGGASTGDRAVLPAARAGRRPAVVFRDGASSQVAVARLGAAPGRRMVGALACDRVHFAGGAGLCLARGSGFGAGYEAKVLDERLRVRHAIDVAGIPSRARVSPDGHFGSVTSFVTGHSYAEAGQFSTQTTLIDLRRGTAIADLEDFTATRSGRRITAVDVNFWGVTFARYSDRFYATLATGGRTHLIEGSVGARSVTVMRENVECPSLSPDGTRIAFKKRSDDRKRPWRLTVLDLATMRETPLAEARSIDDQAEWLDDDTVLYELDGDVWAVSAEGDGRPRRFIAEADSPAVVRR